MKKKLTTLILIFALVNTTFAQNKDHDNIKALKTAFITQQLELTPAQAEKFWPVYNVYENQIHEIRKQNRSEVKDVMKNELQNLSETKALELLKKIQQNREKENELETNLEKELLEQMGAVKVLKLKKAEYEFKMQLLKKYRSGKNKMP